MISTAFQVAGCVACGIGSGLEYNYTCQKQDKRIAENFWSITSSEKLVDVTNGKRFMLQLEVKEPVAIIKIYKQTIITENKVVPFTGFSVGINNNGQTLQYQHGIGTISVPKPGYSSFPHFHQLTSSYFGTNYVIPFSWKVQQVYNFRFDQCQEIQGKGDEISNFLMNHYGYYKILDSNSFYKLEYVDLKGTLVYFLGNKYGDRYYYSYCGSDPEMIARKETGSPLELLTTGALLTGSAICGINLLSKL